MKRALGVWVIGWAIGLVGCGGRAGPQAQSPSAPTANSPARAESAAEANPDAATSNQDVGSPPTPTQPTQLQFQRDNLEQVLASAQRSGKLVFIDAWAEWCHTCWAMESYVLSDPSLVDFQRSFEFVSLDTEKPDNEAFLERFAMDTWPTFFIIDAKTQELIGFWPGAGSVDEMRQFLQQSLDAYDALSAGDESALSWLVKARRAQSQADFKTAAEAFDKAYRLAPPNWPRQSELLQGYIRSLLKLRRIDDCVSLGDKHLDEVVGAARPIQFAQRYFTCVGQSKQPGQQARVQRALNKMRGIAYGDSQHMSPDDRADALQILSQAYAQLGQTQAASQALQDRLALIEQAAAEADSPEQARAFDYSRAMAYVALGKSEAAIQLLNEREKQFPHSYEPPWRLSQVYKQLGQFQSAVQALERAVKRAQGPRQLSLLNQKAKLQLVLNDLPGRVRTLEQEVAERKRLQRSASDKQALREAEAELAQARAQLRSLE